MMPFGSNSSLWWLHWSPIFAGLLLLGQELALSGPVLEGMLPGNDDLMRLQQVRDLLAGQTWFDVNQSRFLTPESGAMHWSRLPDLFIAGLMWVLQPIAGEDMAEPVVLIVWPLILFVITLFAVARICRQLGIGPGGVVAVFFILAQSASMLAFQPGRIDHHGMVLMLVLIGFAALLSAPVSSVSALVLAAAMTAMVSLALEGLVYSVSLGVLLGVFWVVRGHIEAPRLAICGLGLILSGVLFYIVDAPGSGPARQVCDAYGRAHLAAFMAAGSSFLVLGLFGGAMVFWQGRMAAGMLGLLGVAAVFAMTSPGCLGDPYGALSETVRENWLKAVGEALSVSALVATKPGLAITSFGFLTASLAAAGGLMLTASAKDRLPVSAVFILLSVAVLVSMWQFRGVLFASAFASIAAGGWLTSAVVGWWKSRHARHFIVCLLGLVLLMPSGWAAFGFWVMPRLNSQLVQDCRMPALYGKVPKNDVLDLVAPIDLGPSILVYTPHRIFAAPYHRNDGGLDRILSLFLMAPDEAVARLHQLEADGLLYCPGLRETQRYARQAPEGLAGSLERGVVPEGLVPVGLDLPSGAGLQFYRLSRHSDPD